MGIDFRSEAYATQQIEELTPLLAKTIENTKLKRSRFFWRLLAILSVLGGLIHGAIELVMR